MNKGFWEELNKPFFVLAPMADVTDAAFRRLIAKYGKPDVTWTEFVSADGLILGGEKAREVLVKDFLFTEEERPIVAQIFTSKTEVMEQGAALVQSLSFDGLDINMGCPDRSIEKQGAGAALIKDFKKAKELIRAAQRGAPNIPVSVKTRLGYSQNIINEWLPNLLEENLAAVTIHARTRKEMSKVPAQWEEVAHAVKIRDEFFKSRTNDKERPTLIVGNGDVLTLDDARARAKETGCDGVMIGKGIFGNPWRFNQDVDFEKISVEERLRVMVEHTKLFEELLPHKNFVIMKKHYKAYVNGWPEAKGLRVRLMEANNALEVEDITNGYLDIGK